MCCCCTVRGPSTGSVDIVDTRNEVEELLEQAEREVIGSQSAWQSRNAGRARVGARRAAGMAIRAWLVSLDRHLDDYGTNFGIIWQVSLMTINGLSNCESTWRLAARKVPDEGSDAAARPLGAGDRCVRIIHWFRAGERETRGMMKFCFAVVRERTGCARIEFAEDGLHTLGECIDRVMEMPRQ